MFQQLDVADLPEAGIVGVNQIGYDAGNLGEGSITDGRVVPWVQDTDDAAVWASWRINYRDVLVVDGDRKAVFVTNLSNFGLQDEDNYCNLASVLVAVEDGATVDDVRALSEDFDGSCPPGFEFL